MGSVSNCQLLCSFRDCSESLKKSLALALRHSQRQAEVTYDKRTRTEKKGQAIEFARDCAESHPTEDRTSAPKASNLKPGTFVACVESDSTVQQPKILLGRVIHYIPTSAEVMLLWYKPVKDDIYKMTVDGSKWQESEECLLPVKMSAVKGKCDQYQLKTPLEVIHKKMLCD